MGFLLGLVFWIPESLRKVLKIFESLSQPVELVGKQDQLVNLIQFAETTVRVFGAICVDS